MIDERFIFLSLILSAIGGLSYLIDTVKGKARPNRVSWFMWALAPLIAFAAEIKQGVGLVSLMTFAVGFIPFLIFCASFVNKKSVWKLTKFDLACGVLSLLGLVLWLITKVGNIAILFGILADGLAAIPTVVKSYKNPESESSTIFAVSAVSVTIALLTIKEWNFAHYGFPLYILIIDIILFSLIKFKLGKILSKK